MGQHEIDLDFKVSKETVSLSLLGHSLKMPAILLRDRCECGQCYSERTRERKHQLEDIRPDVRPRRIAEADYGLHIVWSDGHDSVYSIDQLASSVAFNTETVERLPWATGFQPAVHDYGNVSSFPVAMKAFLGDFLRHGIVKLGGVPIQDAYVEKVANQIACVREIAFDRVADIIVKKDAYTQGFIPVPLPLHTDCSGYRLPPSVFLFHCLKNSVEGGENLYCDGMAACNELKCIDESAYSRLTKEPMGFRLFSDTHDTRSIAPVINLDMNGELGALRFANWAFQPIENEPKYLRKTISALAKLSEIINSDANILELKLEPGELLMVNNHRVLHGRKAFKVGTGQRHFQQVYMEVDDIEAKWRCL